MSSVDQNALKEAFINAMRRLATTVTIITTGDGTRQAGLTATAVCSLSTEPPALIACINQSARAHDLVMETNQFAVNLLAADQTYLAQLFADPERAQERFTQSKWRESVSGVPLLEGSAATLLCSLDRAVEAFTHTIFIGRVEDVTLDKTSSLLYGTGSFGRFTSPTHED